jgi:transcriptional regulator with XRE-family HTH domain
MGIRDEFKTRLKEARENAGLTQSQLAELSGNDLSTIQKYEGGHRTFGLEKIEHLADVLAVSPASLLGIDTREPVTQVEALRMSLPLLIAISRLPSLEPITALLDALAPGWDKGRRDHDEF